MKSAAQIEAPQRLRLSRQRGFDLAETSRALNCRLCVSVARPGPWGNPFVTGTHGSAETCAALYGRLAAGRVPIDLPQLPLRETLRVVHQHIDRQAVGMLSGRNLACWCAPDQACHGDVLLALANGARLPDWPGADLDRWTFADV